MTTPTARVRFGEIIQFCLNERRLKRRDVANHCGVSVDTLADWILGRSVPSGGQWARLKGMSRALHNYNDQHQAALAEQDTVMIPKIPVTIPHVTMNGARLTANFGDKLVTAIAPTPVPTTTPPPQPSPSKVNPMTGKSIHDFRPNLPPDWKTRRAINARKTFALGILRERPDINNNGPDGLQELLIKRFGVGLSGITELKMQVEAEHARHNIDPDPKPAPAPKRAPSPPTISPNDNLAAAVDLILSSVPNLAAFTIVVDEAGKATVDYRLREVKVVETTGTLSVQRKPA